MATKNTTIGLDTSQGIVYKYTDFPLTFYLTRGYDDTTKSYPMSNNGILGEGEHYSYFVDKSFWEYIDRLDTTFREDLELDVSGRRKVGYKYRVTVQETGDIVKDYDNEFSYVYSQEVVVNIPFEIITTALNPYHLVVTILQDDGETVSSTKPILLADTAPTAFIIVSGGVAYIQLGDEDSDKVRYNIYLNDEKVFPSVADFGDFIDPTMITYVLPRQKILVGEMNRIVVNVEDYWGKSSQTTNDFEGTYVGLMFCDEDEKFYSSDIGAILKYLDMGILQAGKMSDIFTVWIKNTYAYDITDIIITVTEESIPPLNTVFLDTSDAEFIGSSSIVIDETLSFNEKVPFYLRIKPDIMSVGGGIFEITATAIPLG